MPLRPLFTLLLASLAAAVSQAAPVIANSRISAVTVYADRAVVTRTAALDPAATGVIEVAFEKLPTSLLDQSLQVSGRGTAQTSILDVAARATFVDFTPNARIKTLEDELRGLAKQQRAFDDRSAILNGQEASLTRLETAATAAPTKDGAPRLSIEESAKLLAFMEEQRSKLAAERQSLATQVEDLAAKTEATRRQLNELRGSGSRSYKTITVRLDVATAGNLELSLTYALPGASWTPNYDARVNSNEKTVALGYLGLVRQNTGEDWKDIALTLSTARPSLGGAAPETSPWVLDVRRPLLQPNASVVLSPFEVKRKSDAGYGGANVTFSAGRLESAPAAPKDIEATYAQAAVDESATSATFKISTPATIPSDNSPQKVPIVTAALAAAPEYNTTPKLLAAAFLTAKVANSSDFPLLAGAINVFLDGTFVATSSLRTVMPGEKFDLALGVDEGVSVKHKQINRFTEDTGLTNSGKRVTYEYLITLQNNKRTPVHLLVADQVPLSRHEKIVVKLLAPTEKDVKPTAEGTLKWTLDLKPGEKRELTVKFSVDYPNDLPIAGLN